MNALKAANKSPSVRRFVYTGSGTAVLNPKPEQEGIEVSSESWNDESVESAWKEGGDATQRPYHVYAASKVEAERAVWNFQRSDPRRRADLVVNTGEHQLHKRKHGQESNKCQLQYSPVPILEGLWTRFTKATHLRRHSFRASGTPET